MIDWITEYSKAWGACTRWMRSKTNEGYPSKDVSASMADGGMSRSEGVLRQHFGEVRVGQALAVQRVLMVPPLMSFDARMCFHIHYVEKRPQRFKIRMVADLISREIKEAEYFQRLNESHFHLNARIEPIDEKPLKAIYPPRKQPVTA